MQTFLVFAAVLAAVSAAPQFIQNVAVKKVMMVPHQLEMVESHHVLNKPAHGMALSREGGAEIVEQAFDMDEPSHYVYRFKTNNGIAMMEEAALDKDAKVRGAYEWTSPEGVNYKIEYVADELGFHPMGAHLPVAPEIPVAIQRSLEWNAAHPEEDKEVEMHLAKKMMY